MKKFKKQFDYYRVLFETPNMFNGDPNLGFDAIDVITFIYQIQTGAIIFGNVGQKIMHSELFHLLKHGNTSKYNSYGNFDMENINVITEFVTGRIWINMDSISIWDYSDNHTQFADDSYVQKIIHKISILINKKFPININNYTIEVTPILHQDKERKLSF